MKYFLSLVLAFLFLATVTGQENDYSKGILDRDKVIQEAKSLDLSKYPDADEITVDDYTLIEYKVDGTFKWIDDEFIKVLTEKGKRENLTSTLHFNISYEKIRVHLIEIIKPDGKVITVDIEKNSKTMVESGQMGMNIYDPSQKVMNINIPDLEIGDVIRTVSESDNFKSRIPDTWSSELMFEGISPIKHISVEIRAPKALPLKKIQLKDEIKGTVTASKSESDGKIIYKWEIKDVTRLFPEPDMPDMYSVVQRLLLSTIDDWEYLSKWYWKLCEPHLAPSPEMKAEVEKLTANETDRNRKIEKIFNFVSQKIRYMGITTETEAPGYEPHDAKTTFDNKYGVCRDKAALLAAMLRAAGFKAYPVIIMVGPKKDETVPNPYFNHAVVCVQNEDSSYILMDPTDENTRDMFPSYLCNKSYLVAKPEGEKLLTSPIVPAEKNLMRINTVAELTESGALRGETEMFFDGINDTAYRNFIASGKKHEVRRYFEGVLKSAIPDTRLDDLIITPEDIHDTNSPLSAKLNFTCDNPFIGSDGKTMLPIPWLGRNLGIVNMVLGKAGLDKRKYPFVTDIACGTQENFVIKTNGMLGKALSIPEYKNYDTKSLGSSQNLKCDSESIKGAKTFLLKTVEFTPEEYLELKKFLKGVEYDLKKKPVFEAANYADNGDGNSDIIVIGNDIEYELLSENDWDMTQSVKKKILTYAGKKHNSELKIQFNPAWEKVELLDASVTMADGTVKKAKKEEINEMDQPWSGSAPRYPSGKILVVNLPGVEIGAVLDYKIKISSRGKPFFSFIEYFKLFDPLNAKTVRLINKNGKSVSILDSFSPGSPKLENSSDAKIWKTANQQALRTEDSLPPLWTFIPNVSVSCGDWKKYGESINKIFLKAAGTSEKTATRTKELTGKASAEIEKIKIIRDFIAQNIKAAGPSFTELPLSSISEADKTLTDGYGHGADIAILAYAMLKNAGFSPEFILASDYPFIGEVVSSIRDCPQLSFFNNVLVRVKINGEYIYLNDTNQYASLGTTGHEDKAGLATAGNSQFEEIKSAKGKENRTDVEYQIVIDETGSAKIAKTLFYYGGTFSAMNMRFSEMPPEERRRYQQEIISGISQSASADGELFTDFSVYPGIEKITVKAENFAVTEGDMFYFYLPESLRGHIPAFSEKRENPFFISQNYLSNKKFTVKYPQDKFSVTNIKPESCCYAIPGIDAKIKASTTDDKSMEISESIRLTPHVIDMPEYKSLLEINDRLSHPSQVIFLLEKKK